MFTEWIGEVVKLVLSTLCLICHYFDSTVWWFVGPFPKHILRPANVHYYHHQFLNREGRWSTTDDVATNFFHFSLFSTALWDLLNSKQMLHSLELREVIKEWKDQPFVCRRCHQITFCSCQDGDNSWTIFTAVQLKMIRLVSLKSARAFYHLMHLWAPWRHLFSALCNWLLQIRLQCQPWLVILSGFFVLSLLCPSVSWGGKGKAEVVVCSSCTKGLSPFIVFVCVCVFYKQDQAISWMS